MSRNENLWIAIESIKKKHPKRTPQWELSGIKAQTIIGTIKCPKCGNKLHYAISGYNNHFHGNCETENCLAWMM